MACVQRNDDASPVARDGHRCIAQSPAAGIATELSFRKRDVQGPPNRPSAVPKARVLRAALLWRTAAWATGWAAARSCRSANRPVDAQAGFAERQLPKEASAIGCGGFRFQSR